MKTLVTDGAGFIAHQPGRTRYDGSMKVQIRRVVMNEAVVFAELDDEAILLNIENGVYHGLNTLGTRIWQLWGQPAGEDEILRQLLEEYDVEPTQLRADYLKFLQGLADLGLVQILDENDG